MARVAEGEEVGAGRTADVPRCHVEPSTNVDGWFGRGSQVDQILQDSRLPDLRDVTATSPRCHTGATGWLKPNSLETYFIRSAKPSDSPLNCVARAWALDLSAKAAMPLPPGVCRFLERR